MKVGHREYKTACKDKTQPWTLEETIAVDCEHWEKLNNSKMMLESYLYLNKCKDSEESGMYQLILNGTELHFGTLNEINAVVKTMIKLIENASDYEP